MDTTFIELEQLLEPLVKYIVIFNVNGPKLCFNYLLFCGTSQILDKSYSRLCIFYCMSDSMIQILAKTLLTKDWVF